MRSGEWLAGIAVAISVLALILSAVALSLVLP